MISRVRTIRGRGGVACDLDQRLTTIIAELESLIHDLLHDDGQRTEGAKPAIRVASAGAAGASERARAQAAFEAWLTSDRKPDVWQRDAPDDPQTSLTGMLGELVVSRREMTADAADALCIPPGTTLGYAATELLLAVNDSAGPRCRSFRSAIFYLRDHGDALVSPEGGPGSPPNGTTRSTSSATATRGGSGSRHRRLTGWHDCPAHGRQSHS